jgi:hypothetical protein
MAKLHVLNCKFDHDECRNTKKYRNAGQNLYAASSSDKIEYKSHTSAAVTDWFNEFKDASKSDLAECCGPRFSDIGHFTQIVRDVNEAIGCAAITYSEDDWNKIIVTCDYSETNMMNQPIYISGKSASKCSSTNSKFPSLCYQ